MKTHPIYIHGGDDFDGYEFEFCDECGIEIGSEAYHSGGHDYCKDCWELINEYDLDYEEQD